MNQEKIGKFIASCRKEKKLTQNALAEKLGVSNRAISNWENGKNMPDLSLFNDLCKELGITVNELLSGEKLTKEKNIKKYEENIAKTIYYTNQKIKQKDKIIANCFLIFGLGIIFTAIMIFPSESSWGSIYSINGAFISLIGFILHHKGQSLKKIIIFSWMYFLTIMAILFSLDYCNVLLNDEAPRFSYKTTTINKTIYYDTLFYDVVRCDKDTIAESWHIISNHKYDELYIMNYCD